MSKSAIYETTGKAREYSELALNLYPYCTHGCLYCYTPGITRIERERFRIPTEPRLTVREIELAAIKMRERGDKRRVLLCFTCDPYSSGDSKLTRQAIELLHANGIGVTILTKGGRRSMRDFDLLGPRDSYAATLTCYKEADSFKWEPGAASPAERLMALREALERGIETWVSFEPVLFPEQNMVLLELSREFVGHYKVGTLNYLDHAKTIDWYKFGWDIKNTMDRLQVKYYFKKDLLKKMGIDPEHFRQTWKT